MHFRIATNDNKLAVIHADIVGGKLQEKGHTYELVKVSSRKIDKIRSYIYGEERTLIRKLQNILLGSQADVVVQAAKDIIYNYETTVDFAIPAILERESHREVVITRDGQNFLKLPEGAKIGVSSKRKAAQLKISFPYMETEFLSGNVETKLEKLENKAVDAIIISQADVRLLDLEDKVDVVLESDVIMPAFGQGMLAVQCKKDNETIIEALQEIDNKESHDCFKTEQAVLKELNCAAQIPVAGYCEYSGGGSLRILAFMASSDGKKIIRARRKEKDISPEELGHKIAEDLFEQGAKEIMK